MMEKDEKKVTEESACQQELKELNEKFMRVSADLHNIHARMAKERALWAQDIQLNFFKELLPVIDDFERALVQEEHPRVFELMHKKLVKFLHAHGVHEIDCSGAFDPHMHEALMHVTDAQKKTGDIVQVLQKGYRLKGAVIRPARVSVAQ